MMHMDDLKLFLPLDSTAPQSAHMFHELRSLGYSLAVGWRCEPFAAGDATTYDALLDAAGGDDTGLSDGELASFQRWRRSANVMWVSELLQADGRTLRTRFNRDLNRRVRNCEPGAMQLCTVAFGLGRTTPARRKRAGFPRPALWSVLGVGDRLWRDDKVCVIIQRQASSALVRVLERIEHDDTTSKSVCTFAGNSTGNMAYDLSPSAAAPTGIATTE